MRPPADLPQTLRGASVSYVAANVLYMFDCVPTPNVNWTDTQLSRQPNEAAEPLCACLLWVNQGLKVHTISPFDMQAYFARGFDYVREFYSEEWDASWEAITAEQDAKKSQTLRQASAILAQYRSYREDVETPTVVTINRALDKRKAVALVLESKSHHPTTSVLTWAVIYKREYTSEGSVYHMYYPTPPNMGSTLTTISHPTLVDPNGPWLRKEGIVVIGR